MICRRHRDEYENVAKFVTCIFWNVNRASRTDLICRLVAEAKADLIVLAESGVDREVLLQNLRAKVENSFHVPPSSVDRLQVFARFEKMAVRETYADVSGRVSIRTLHVAETELLFAAVHLQSKVNWNNEDQLAEAITLADEIRREEKRHGHNRTIVFGDFNMNPFEPGIVAANGFNAMMTRVGVSE